MTGLLMVNICTNCKRPTKTDGVAPLFFATQHSVPWWFKGKRDPEKITRCLGSNRPTKMSFDIVEPLSGGQLEKEAIAA